MVKALHVFLYGEHIGTLTRGTMATVAFRFDRDVSMDTVLSLSMPTRTGGKYSVDQASPFFNGLLPDGPDARLRMAQSFDSLDTSTFTLLSRAGLDCAGAVQVWHEPELPGIGGELAPLTEADVAARLRASMDSSGEGLRDDAEHWSLSGAQRKIALRRIGDAWHLPTGTEPSSHIIKPGVTTIAGVRHGDQALAEHVTLTAAAALGVDAATSAYVEFDGVPAVVVERFDRTELDDRLLRVHQEDMCQAMGVDSTGKYETDGGPGAARIASLLWQAIPDPREAEAAVRCFALMVAFNYLVEGSDAHAKNFALLHPRDADVALAPMYDAASGALASRDDGTRRFPKAAMRVGAQYAFAAAETSDWHGLLRDMRLPADEALLEQFRTMAAALPDAVATALDNADAPPEVKGRLRATPLLARISESASAGLAALRGALNGGAGAN